MDMIYQGLQELAESSFPKTCAVCGRCYLTLEDFISKTQPISRSSGLKSAMEDDGTAIVELFRNCVCGSTLMDVCQDRRSGSERGLKRREKFEELLERLLERNIAEQDARNALLLFVRNGDYTALEGLGVKVRTQA